jgi:predicted ATPase
VKDRQYGETPMRLVEIGLRNFRCYKDEVRIPISNITVFIGRNDAGKSSILDALNIFFDDDKPDSDDGCKFGDTKDVRIICVFNDLPENLVLDASHQTNLKNEHLLNTRGLLEIHKVYDCSLKTPKLLSTYAIANHPTAENYTDLLSLKNADLKKRAHDLSIDLSSVDSRVNAHVRAVIWNTCPDLMLQECEIDLVAEDAKKIWEQLKRELPAFSLFKSDRTSTDQDAEAQDPMKAAVDEAIKAKETELNAIANYVKKEVETIAEKTVEKLREMDSSLASGLTPQFSKPTWKNVFKISLTGDNDISINKRGSGVRRLILLNFFRAKAEQKISESNAPGIIYAVEEPETSQHPDNQRMLIDAFVDLANEQNRQVILSTHTPMLVRALPEDSLRYIEVGEENDLRIIHSGTDDTIRLVAKALGVLADHDVKLFVGVEGRNDINFLYGISKVMSESDPTIPNLYECESRGKIIFFPMGGANLALWASRMKNLNIPEFYLQDSDLKVEGISKHQSTVDNINARQNCEAILTKKREMENYIHPDAIRAVRSEVNIQFSDYDDVPLLAAKALHDASESTTAWDNLSDKKKEEKLSKAKRWLNADAVLHMTPDMLSERDSAGDVISWLKKIGQLINSRST